MEKPLYIVDWMDPKSGYQATDPMPYDEAWRVASAAHKNGLRPEIFCSNPRTLRRSV